MEIAEKCVVYSVRATSFYALGLIATTKLGADYLFKSGWVCARHDRHDRWPIIEEENWSERKEEFSSDVSVADSDQTCSDLISCGRVSSDHTSYSQSSYGEDINDGGGFNEAGRSTNEAGRSTNEAKTHRQSEQNNLFLSPSNRNIQTYNFTISGQSSSCTSIECGINERILIDSVENANCIIEYEKGEVARYNKMYDLNDSKTGKTNDYKISDLKSTETDRIPCIYENCTDILLPKPISSLLPNDPNSQIYYGTFYEDVHNTKDDSLQLNFQQKSSTLPANQQGSSVNHKRSLSESKTFEMLKRDQESLRFISELPRRKRDNSYTESTTSGVSSCDSVPGRHVFK